MSTLRTDIGTAEEDEADLEKGLDLGVPCPKLSRDFLRGGGSNPRPLIRGAFTSGGLNYGHYVYELSTGDRVPHEILPWTRERGSS